MTFISTVIGFPTKEGAFGFQKKCSLLFQEEELLAFINDHLCYCNEALNLEKAFFSHAARPTIFSSPNLWELFHFS